MDNNPTIVSALGAIPKHNSTKIRLIHDCSKPDGLSVNDYANADSFSYQTIQDAVQTITPGCYMAKVDLSNAYRSVKIHESNFAITGIHWTFEGNTRPTVMIDTRLPFGAKLAPSIFNDLSQAVRRIMHRKGFPSITAYLDDFLIVSPTKHECLNTMNTLIKLLRSLGFAINYSKVEGPCTKMTFLGIVLDSTSMTLNLPQQRICELQDLLHKLRQKPKVTKRMLQSLAGKLNWATQCIYGGRFHLRRILDKIATLRSPGHYTRLTRDMILDMDWWLNFMEVFNGCISMLNTSPVTPLCIDACPTAAGPYYDKEYVYTSWMLWPEAKDHYINYKETLALEPAVNIRTEWASNKVIVHCDNQAAVGIINKGSSKDPVVMASLRRIFWYSALSNFHLKAV